MSRCAENFGQLVNPCSSATKYCASARRHRSRRLPDARSLFQRSSIRCAARFKPSRMSSVISVFCNRASRSIRSAAQARTAPGLPDLHACWRSLASFLYWLRFGRGARGRASDIRISFHRMPGVRTSQAERRFVWVLASDGWARPFPRTGCAPRAESIIDPGSAIEFAKSAKGSHHTKSALIGASRSLRRSRS